MEKNSETLFTIKCRPPFILTYFLTEVLKNISFTATSCNGILCFSRIFLLNWTWISANLRWYQTRTWASPISARRIPSRFPHVHLHWELSCGLYCTTPTGPKVPQCLPWRCSNPPTKSANPRSSHPFIHLSGFAYIRVGYFSAWCLFWGLSARCDFGCWSTCADLL